MSKKKFWDNSSLQQDIQWDNQTLPGLTDEELLNTNWNLKKTKSDREKLSKSNKEFKKLHPITPERKKRTGDSMRGKTLEELIGVERAAVGRKKRSEFHRGKKRPGSVGKKISKTRKANGSYVDSGMTGHSHKDSTKSKMSIKAKVRQDLKRQLGLGKSDKVPTDILVEEYKRRGLQ